MSTLLVRIFFFQTWQHRKFHPVGTSLCRIIVHLKSVKRAFDLAGKGIGRNIFIFIVGNEDHPILPVGPICDQQTQYVFNFIGKLPRIDAISHVGMSATVLIFSILPPAGKRDRYLVCGCEMRWYIKWLNSPEDDPLRINRPIWISGRTTSTQIVRTSRQILVVQRDG